ncbi:hypothetical protein OVA26_16515 [Microbacterium sp. SL62]|uniref:hypothetical protein n=1 Tax=Microbacterium sp. SL62 TaxID=2995139 RepID=UPI002273E8C1|nr:hypothetical protein [Microbacterium sp. SL62]MCY1718541.1 hypothetical protein [Microbacterium sp. SL62]
MSLDDNPAFHAAHAGSCTGCQRTFDIGDSIRRALEGWQHAACPPRLCPLDGHHTDPHDDLTVVCRLCREILLLDETVTAATPETRFAYLAVGETDTDPEDASIERLIDGARPGVAA